MYAHILATALLASTLFSASEPVSLELTAPFNDLFAHARTDDSYAVTGTLSYSGTDKLVTSDAVKVSVRGNTSRRESECAFPKLKVQFSESARSAIALFAGMKSIKIGTHCGEAPADGVTARFGRLPNEQSPRREVFVYSLLDALGIPALKARAAMITYVYTDAKPGQDQRVARHALLLEGADEAVRRMGGHRDISEREFTTAQAAFTPADTLGVAFAEAMIGNFDWCLRMTPEDRYRCDARHPLWNIAVAEMEEGKERPLLYDFDVAGIVTGRHPWFADVFNAAFVRSRSPIETEVVAQVQRTRALFARPELDAARTAFVTRKDQAFQTLHAASLDAQGRRQAQSYLEAFYDAIESDAAFYRPVVTAHDAKAYANAGRDALCPGLEAIPPGTPVSDPMQVTGSLVQVILLDALWAWAPPFKCTAIHGPVWIEAGAISREFPK